MYDKETMSRSSAQTSYRYMYQCALLLLRFRTGILSFGIINNREALNSSKMKLFTSLSLSALSVFLSVALAYDDDNLPPGAAAGNFVTLVSTYHL